ncbi:hypothetical protein ACQJBY_056741 [Aegilops geniculata]
MSNIFPEDSIIEKKTLISRWIAEGFIHKEGIYTAYEVGVRCFNELINRSLIQPVKKDDYRWKSCRVHDIILDFIVSKSIEENFATFAGVPSLTTVTQGKVRRLSMQVEGKGDSILPMSLILSHVRSFNVFRNTVNIHSTMEFRHLRVVDFNDSLHLANVGRLLQLRYLSIYMTAVSELPEQIGHLQCLEMLDIRYTMVSELPASIVNLGKLAHLLLGSEDTCVKFPDGIAKMQALETLDHVDACKQSYNFLQGLGELKNLRKLHIDYHDVAQEDKEVIASSLGKLCTQNLCSLTMWENDDDDFLLNTWCTSPPLNLRKLVISGCIFPKVPHWVGSLVNLQKLHLEVGRGTRHEDICILGALPALLTLGLRGSEKQPSCEDRRLAVSGELKNLRKLHIDYHDVAQEDKEVIASSLGKLCTQNLCSLTMWENDDDDFLLNTWCTSPPLNLRKLVISGCIFPKVPHWVGSLVNLQKLHLEVGRGTRHEDICILGALPALLTLGLRGSEKQPSCEDRRLAVSGELKNLRKLHIDYHDVAQEDKEVIASSLGKLCTQNLCSLTMWENDDDDFLLNTWCTSPPLNLRKLVISGCIFPKVPHWVGSLVNLQKLHLEVGRGTRHEDICILGALPALLTLGLRGSEKQPSCEDRRLAVSGELKNLRKLHIDYHDVAQEDKEVIASSLGKLCTQNLCSLTMWENDDDDFLLNTWCTSPPLNLRKLVISGCIFPKVPHWVGSLVNLQKLHLEVGRGTRHEDICILGALPALLTLGLRGSEKQPSCEDRRLAVSGEAGFRCLRKFKYWRQGDWMDPMFTAKCMPRLEKLKIIFYRHAKDEAPIIPAFDFGIENLSSLTTFKCHLGCMSNTRSDVDAVKASLDRVVSTHPNHLTLIFSYCCVCKSFDCGGRCFLSKDVQSSSEST